MDMWQQIHETNRNKWNAAADRWSKKYDPEHGRRLLIEPHLAFRPVEAWLTEHVGSLRGKNACVLGSGDNHTTFALAGMGATVTSVDISKHQLEYARQRADALGLTSVEFVQADIADLPLPPAAFDFACSIGVVAAWIADLSRYYGEVYRVLKPGGYFMGTEMHPVRRIFEENAGQLTLVNHYFDQSPQRHSYEEVNERGDGVEVEQVDFLWKVSDFVNAQVEVGLQLVAIAETPFERLEHWQDEPQHGLPRILGFLSRKPARRTKSQPQRHHRYRAPVEPGIHRIAECEPQRS